MKKGLSLPSRLFRAARDGLVTLLTPETILNEQPPSPPGSDRLELTGSRGFRAWMAECEVSIACTTYNSGRLFLFGQGEREQLSVCEWASNRCMGLWTDGTTVWVSSRVQLWRLENMLPPGELADGHDRLFMPRAGHVTGDIDIHDLAPASDGRVVFANTMFSCLATVSDSDSFSPVWKPPFISRLAPEDRCHLNGLAMEDGRPAYVTTVSRSDVADGWRDRREDGGLVIDVRSNEAVLSGLSMPHSPRLYRDRLWLHDSGTGHFGYADLNSGKFEQVAFCPGYLRGLDFVGKYAVVGLSKSRHVSFGGLALDKNLTDRDAEQRCGIYVIDLDTGSVVHWLRMEGMVNELYDVAVMPGVRRPRASDFRSPEVANVISIGKPQQFDNLELSL